ERALASAIFDSGSRLGTAIAFPLVSVVIAHFGWRWSFVASALLGIAWALAWWSIYRRPSEHPWAGEEGLSYLREGGARIDGGAKGGATLRWSELFRYRTVWGMAVGFFCLSFVIYFYLTWFPTYLREARGFSAMEVGTLGMIPPLIATLGGWS